MLPSSPAFAPLSNNDIISTFENQFGDFVIEKDIKLIKKFARAIEKYKKSLDKLTYTTVSGPSTPRGRIYDRNLNILVDNKSLKIYPIINIEDIRLSMSLENLFIIWPSGIIS